jgi:hypothetical protein
MKRLVELVLAVSFAVFVVTSWGGIAGIHAILSLSILWWIASLATLIAAGIALSKMRA